MFSDTCKRVGSVALTLGVLSGVSGCGRESREQYVARELAGSARTAGDVIEKADRLIGHVVLVKGTIQLQADCTTVGPSHFSSQGHSQLHRFQPLFSYQLLSSEGSPLEVRTRIQLPDGECLMLGQVFQLPDGSPVLQVFGVKTPDGQVLIGPQAD